MPKGAVRKGWYSASDKKGIALRARPKAKQQCGRAQPHPKGLPPEWSATLPTGGSGAVGDGGIKYNNHFARIAACCRATMLIMFNTKQPLSFFCIRAEKKGRPMRHHVGMPPQDGGGGEYSPSRMPDSDDNRTATGIFSKRLTAAANRSPVASSEGSLVYSRQAARHLTIDSRREP